MIYDKDSRIRRVNETFYRMLGYEALEVIGKDLDSLVATDKYQVLRRGQGLYTGEPGGKEGFFRDKTGQKGRVAFRRGSHGPSHCH
ncbi:MAG: PAS domain S-box protein [Thermovirgaceae bacterium]